MLLTDLCNDTLDIIFSYLSNKDERLMRVNKLFYNYINKKKSYRFQLIKYTLFNYLILLQNKLYKKFDHDYDYTNISYSNSFSYIFKYKYNECIFNDTSKINYIVHNLCINELNSHILLHFDVYLFDYYGWFAFKLFEAHLSEYITHTVNFDDMKQYTQDGQTRLLPSGECKCLLCDHSVSNSHNLPKIKSVCRIYSQNLSDTTDIDNFDENCEMMRININDDDVIEKLNLFFTIQLNNIYSFRRLPYNLYSHNLASISDATERFEYFLNYSNL